MLAVYKCGWAGKELNGSETHTIECRATWGFQSFRVSACVHSKSFRTFCEFLSCATLFCTNVFVHPLNLLQGPSSFVPTAFGYDPLTHAPPLANGLTMVLSVSIRILINPPHPLQPADQSGTTSLSVTGEERRGLDRAYCVARMSITQDFPSFANT